MAGSGAVSAGAVDCVDPLKRAGVNARMKRPAIFLKANLPEVNSPVDGIEPQSGRKVPHRLGPRSGNDAEEGRIALSYRAALSSERRDAAVQPNDCSTAKFEVLKPADVIPLIRDNLRLPK